MYAMGAGVEEIDKVMAYACLLHAKLNGDYSSKFKDVLELLKLSSTQRAEGQQLAKTLFQ